MLRHIYDFAIKKSLSNDNRYKQKYIKKCIVLTESGDFVGIEENENKNDKTISPQYPERVTYGNTPNFLIEKGIVIFDKQNKKHDNYMCDLLAASKLSHECSLIYELLNHEAFLDVVDGLNLAQSQDLFNFKIGSKYATDIESWKPYFENKYQEFVALDEIKQKSDPMVSVVTGDIVSPVKNTDKVSVGGATTGTGDVIICCDKASYQSYGLDGALNGAVSKEESEAIKNGLEYLLRNNYNKDWNMVHWYDKELNPQDDILNALFDPYDSFLGDILNEGDELTKDEKDVLLSEYLQSCIRDGKITSDFSELKGTNYYLFNYRPCGGRIAFSNSRTGNFDDMFKNILLFYQDSAIQKTYFIKDGEKWVRKNSITPIFNIKVILLSCLNSNVEGNKKFEQVNKEFNIYKKQSLLNVVIGGEQIPFDFVQRCVRNIKDDIRSGNTPPTVLYQMLKVYINRERRKDGKGNIIMETLNQKNDNVAYNLGRLFCVYAKIQEAALGDVNAGITEKFYASASTSPAYVFGQLANKSNYHLKKIENKGLAIYYKEMLREIASTIDIFPKTLNIVEQGNFSLGFYQQEQYMYSKKNNVSETNKED